MQANIQLSSRKISCYGVTGPTEIYWNETSTYILDFWELLIWAEWIASWLIVS